MGRLLGLPQRKKWFKAVERTVLLPSQEQWRVSMCSHLRGMLQAVLSTGAPPSPVRAPCCTTPPPSPACSWQSLLVPGDVKKNTDNL